MVMQDGQPVGYMYREAPDSAEDSGWRFFSGYESDEYMDDPSNTHVYPVAFVVEADSAVIPYLESASGSQFERNEDRFDTV
jgi:hypothetical protein